MKLEQISYQAGINVVCSDDHIWVTAKQIEELLETTKRVVSYHIKELEELNQFVAGEHFVTLPITHMEGDHKVTRHIRHYSELAVIRIGFRMNSEKALAFQEWAAKTLLTLKREGVVFDTSAKPRGTEHLTDMEKWDYDVSHQLLDALNIPPMESLPARIGLLIDLQKKPPTITPPNIYSTIKAAEISSSIKAAEIFSSIIRDGLNSGEIYLEGEVFPEYDQRPRDANGHIIKSLPKGKLIGFYHSPRYTERSVALFGNPAFTYVQTVLRRQGEQILDRKKIWTQLYRAGYINLVEKTDKYPGNIRYDALTFNKVMGRRVRAMNLAPQAVLGESSKALKASYDIPLEE